MCREVHLGSLSQEARDIVYGIEREIGFGVVDGGGGEPKTGVKGERKKRKEVVAKVPVTRSQIVRVLSGGMLNK